MRTPSSIPNAGTPASPTQSATAIPTIHRATPTSTVTTITSTRTPSHGPLASHTPFATRARPTASLTPLASPTPPPFPGDCNHDAGVTVDELIKGVNIAFGTLSIRACASFDTSADDMVTIDALITAVNRALESQQ